MNASDIELQKLWFRAKLAAEKQKMEVIKKVQEGRGDFVLLDARDRKSFEKGHIPGALSMPLDELDQRIGELDRGREYVTYCWNAT
jgi:rhodanese-related sulfurtransferase